jgi:hypothetical protein
MKGRVGLRERRTRPRGWTIGVFALVFGLILVLLTWMAAPAQAASYNVVQCHQSFSRGFPNAPAFSANYLEGGPSVGRTHPSNKCADGQGANHGGLGIYEAGGPAQTKTWAQWAWNAPPTTYFSEVLWQEHTNNGGGWAPYFLWYPDPSGAPTSVGALLSAPDWSNGRFVRDNPMRSFQVFLECFGGCTDQSAHNYVRRIWFEIQDSTKPTIELGGQVLAGGLRAGSEPLKVSARDPGAGLRYITVSVNGANVPGNGRDLTAQCVLSTSPAGATALRFSPCPNPATYTTTMHTESGPWQQGANLLEVCAHDYAGNERCISRTVQVDNSCQGSGGIRAERLDAGIVKRGDVRARAFLSSRRRPVVRGQLSDARGDPVNDATICVYQRVKLPDASWQLVATPRTQPNGRFATYIDRGASRALRFVYRYNNRFERDAAKLHSIVRPAFKISPKVVRNGNSVRFTGRLPGPNRDRRVVVIQARGTKKWITFKAPRTNRAGFFRARYRFSRTSGTARYVFRALVKRQRGYPYVRGRSFRRAVLVRGR